MLAVGVQSEEPLEHRLSVHKQQLGVRNMFAYSLRQPTKVWPAREILKSPATLDPME